MGALVLLLLIILLVLAGVGVGIFFIVKSSSKPKHPVYPPQQQYPPQGWGG